MIETATERVHCFSNGSEHQHYEDTNCSRCTKHWDREQKFRCELQEAMSLGSISDGLVPAEFMPRLGLTDDHKRYGIPIEVDGEVVNFGALCKELDPDVEIYRRIYRRDMAQREAIRRGPWAVRFSEKYKRRDWFQYKYWGSWAPSPWTHPIRFWFYPIEYRIRMRIAFWLNKHTDLCWASLVSWYMNPVDHPFFEYRDYRCRDCIAAKDAPGQSCWCGKFRGPESEADQ